MTSYLVTIATDAHQPCVKMCVPGIRAQLLKTAGVGDNSFGENTPAVKQLAVL